LNCVSDAFRTQSPDLPDEVLERGAFSETPLAFERRNRMIEAVRFPISAQKSAPCESILMSKRIILGSLLSSIVMFLWGWFWWDMLAGEAPGVRAEFSEENTGALVESLKTNLSETGVYFYPPKPDMSDEVAVAAWEARHREGPLVQINYVADGKEPMDPKTMGTGFALGFIASLFVATLIAVFSKSLTTYFARFGFVVCLGVFLALWCDGNSIVWWRVPAEHVVFQAGYNITVWALAGLVLAGVVKNK
jgi:hypothetical protein